MSDPVFMFGKGRTQITVKGEGAIRACGRTLQMLVVARAVGIILSSSALVGWAIWLLR